MQPPPTDDPPRPLPATGPAARRALLDAFAVAQAAVGGLEPDAVRFVEAAAERIVRRLRAAGLPTDDASIAAAVPATHATDLYLVLAADADVASAWTRLTQAHVPLLTGTLVRRGAPPGEAESLVADLLGDLAGPPPGGGARTLLGTYAGIGPLAGWLCVIALRRWSAHLRRRRPPGALPTDPGGRWASLPGRQASAPDPLARSISSEALERFAATFDEAWERLAPRERLVLAAKHGDGRSQAEIARALRVSEATASRLVTGALQRLRDALPEQLFEPGDERLAALVAGRLARAAAESPLSYMGLGPPSPAANVRGTPPSSAPGRRSAP